MKIIDYYAGDNQEYWLNQIGQSDWRAGKYLYRLIREDRVKECYGVSTKVLLLTEGDRLVSFCTYAEQDEIKDPELTPWIGFVYTFPAYRGKRCIGKLLEYGYALAKTDGYSYLYLSSDEIGLYEKYGFSFWRKMRFTDGHETQVFRKEVTPLDYSHVLGMQVSGTIDRPLGSVHPDWPDLVYPVNYGYVDGIIAGDGEEQDMYVFGADRPLTTFTGRVIAVWHRLNDCEDKWIVRMDGRMSDREEILRTIDFQERYYMGELYI